MEELAKLSTHQCVLLAAQYATESNIAALRALTALRKDDLEFGLILRLLLTFLPEAVEPVRYIEYLHSLVTGSRETGDEQPTLDASTVNGLSAAQARKRARRLHVLLQPLPHPLYERETDLDPFTHFLMHRSHRVDTETGLLELVPQLVVPFLHHADYLRTWFVSTVLPLLRLGYEYYPQQKAPTLEEFAQLQGKRAIETQLAYLRRPHNAPDDAPSPAQILRGVMGPWLCGTEDRKRRASDVEARRPSTGQLSSPESDDWECLFQWLVHMAKADLGLVSRAYMEWDGPDDLDLGGYDEGQVYVDEERQGQLERRYAQSALAALYTIDNSSAETHRTAHSLLTRLGNLLSIDLLTDLPDYAVSLPEDSLNRRILDEASTSMLQEESILRPSNPLTQPSDEALHLLELFTLSAHLLSTLQHPLSVKDVAKLHIRNDSAEQMSHVQKILHTLSSGAKQDGEQWAETRRKLVWLWNWGTKSSDAGRHGHGIFGSLEHKAVEVEFLKALLESGLYTLAVQIYINGSPNTLPLSASEVENVVLKAAMHHYDNASNGNRTRGGMKRASDMVAAFQSLFSSSARFYRSQALFSATHALSFYSLILQHGVPFQPVNIRVSEDPLALLRKLLSQNHGSYTHLDDLISIGQNLIVAMPSTLMDETAETSGIDLAVVERKKAVAERRVICMAIEAALEEDDFETAYSYVVNRLPPTTSSTSASPAASTSSQRFSFGSTGSDANESETEDVAWRAALQAGRYRSSPMSASGNWSGTWGSGNWSGAAARPDLRRLEQRMELLSQALLLAPPRHLEEVLDVWQQCEKEMTKVLAEEADAEERFNDMADRRLPGAFATETVAIQPRREVGRGAAAEAPMGLFDVARGAAAALSKSAFPLRANSSASRTAGLERSVDSDMLSDAGSAGGGEDRVRKRDMVANAVTGGLASGLGWVLGATPAQGRE
ncbi:secretory pathway Sec39 [Lophiostoma macrostomum CBS 122681]|uniref:Secretory pathway Sec39 n=1 Tax=Lophiostoma macrostomum CBS 122681 TaxID=1314788 RepID=A0A6A6SJL8_9PLEO|nr:secretory pathway Sec39 [Lophiostoma macrostomum CBS 122681]